MSSFTEKSLKLMPSNGLTGLSNSLMVEKNKKLSEQQSANAKVSKLQGTAIIKTPTAGRLTVNQGGEQSANAAQQGMSSPSLAWANGANVLNNGLTNPQDIPVFVPGTTDEIATQDDVTQMNSEIESFFDESSPNQASPRLESTVAMLNQKSSALQTDINQIDVTQALIADILQKRADGKLPEPQLNLEALDMNTLPPGVRRMVATSQENLKEFVEDTIIAPFAQNELFIEALTAQLSGIDIVSPTFDLEYGPPISAGNKFVLSQDGLYYNSRTQEVPQIPLDPLSSTMWTLDYDSNKGGRGAQFTEEDGYTQAGTIFALETDLGENSQRVIDFYEYDDVLQQFADDRQAQLTEVSGYISEIKNNGYSETDAVVQSYYAQLGSVVATYDTKIRKRKRQLEIAAIYGRESFMVTDRDHPLGEGIFFEYVAPTGKLFEYKLKYDDQPDSMKTTSFLEGEGGATVAWDTVSNEVVDVPDAANVIAIQGKWQEIPRVPINDFSYLKSSDVPLPLQRKITLFSEDLDTVVAPYQAKYVVAPETPENFTDALAVDMIGYGDWVHRESSGSISSITPSYKSLTDDIASDELVACYNFLDPEAVTQPSGTLYGLNNAAEGSPRMDGKLVGYSPSFVFPSGVGTAYMGGTIFDEEAKYGTEWSGIKGSYVSLPNITKGYETFETPYRGSKPLDNIFYGTSGVSFDFWTYVPTLTDALTPFHRYRLVLSNENSGPVVNDYVNAGILSKNGGPTTIGLNQSTNRTVGMMIGWRDKGDPQGAGTTRLTSSSGLEFIISPTVSQNQYYTENPTVSWGHSTCIAEKWDGTSLAPSPTETSEVGMYVTSSIRTSDGSGIGDASGSFVHFNISFDYPNNETRIMLDGKHLVTSSITDVLGVKPEVLQTPTAVRIDLADKSDTISYNNPTKESFLGNDIYDEYVTPERVAFPVFTPWIIGGGYSDNMPSIAGTSYRPQGFLGSNTNNTYQETTLGQTVVTETIGSYGTFITGQHTPPLSNGSGGSNGSRYQIPRSGLDGYVGSFKIYAKPLSTTEATLNFDSQKGFFKNILL